MTTTARDLTIDQIAGHFEGLIASSDPTGEKAQEFRSKTAYWVDWLIEDVRAEIAGGLIVQPGLRHQRGEPQMALAPIPRRRIEEVLAEAAGLVEEVPDHPAPPRAKGATTRKRTRSVRARVAEVTVTETHEVTTDG